MRKGLVNVRVCPYRLPGVVPTTGTTVHMPESIEFSLIIACTIPLSEIEEVEIIGSQASTFEIIDFGKIPPVAPP